MGMKEITTAGKGATMKDFTESLIVKNEAIIEFLAWAAKQPRTIGKVHLTIEDVPEPR